MKTKLILPVLLFFLAAGVAFGAPTEAGSPESDTNVLLWPTMDYTNFLAGHPDEAKRAEMWRYFLEVEREAKGFAGTRNHWKPIHTATLGKGIPIYVTSGRIRMNTNSGAAIFHEIFHDTFHGSRFNQGEDKAWAEAFCDAFRYMMEKKYLPEPRSSWFLKLDRFSDETYTQVMARSGDKHFDQKYLYPASLIVHKADRNLEKFRALWFELQDLRKTNNADVLNNYFGYDMKNGKPL
ncbi:MAG TPA: hypothetical protein VK815_18525 [Candidatus Acidoferrales bacterium]|jgi:hypothetical protein|nr:hypothetical protein [Candidatus Acidoferrales bacterium]